MKTGVLFGMSIVTGILVVAGLPIAMGIFFRGFLKKSNPYIPAALAATVILGIQQILVYRGDARISTVLPRLQSALPESMRHESWVMACLVAVLMGAGLLIPFIFACIGIRISDFIDRILKRVSDFTDRIMHRKQG